VNTAAPARARASLVGLAIGDAFGEALASSSDADRRAALRLISRHLPWRWTDDTAMALSIVETLERHGTIDTDALAAAFVRRWAAEPDRGYGQGANDLLACLRDGAAWRDEAPRLFRGRGSWGNGAAMRAAPIGAYVAASTTAATDGVLERVRDEALRSAAPTHAHPDGAAGAVAVAIAAALVASRIASGADRTTLLETVVRYTPPGNVRARLERAARIPLDADPVQVGEALGTGLDIAAHDTVPFCLWIAARHLDSYEEAIWAATSPPGDRDTNGAIVGGIVVLATGIDAIPVLWRAAVEPLPVP
jgi:ADP-ribosylglycohydrolase